MYRRCCEEIVQQPHPFREFSLREYPTTSQSTQTKSLRQTTRHDKLFAKMKTRPRRLFKQRLHVNFINQHARTYASRYLADLLHRRILNQHTARIVKARDDDQFGLRSD